MGMGASMIFAMLMSAVFVPLIILAILRHNSRQHRLQEQLFWARYMRSRPTEKDLIDGAITSSVLVENAVTKKSLDNKP